MILRRSSIYQLFTKTDLDQFLRVLHETGYEMLPVNPNPNIKEIRGLKVFHNLKEVNKPVDMVQVFRRKEELLSVAKEAISTDKVPPFLRINHPSLWRVPPYHKSMEG